MPDEEKGIYEVEELLDRRVGKKTRFGRLMVEYLVRWKGFEEPTWVSERALNCGGLIYDFERELKTKERFSTMQSAEEES